MFEKQDYWADIPSRKHMFNFDKIMIKYYKSMTTLIILKQNMTMKTDSKSGQEDMNFNTVEITLRLNIHSNEDTSLL